MKNNNLLKSLLCLAVLLAVMAACVLGVNAFTAPIVAENERLAEEARLAAEKEKLGDSVMLFDRADPENAQLTVTADTVQKVYRDEEKQVYILSLRSDKGYEHEKGPIEMTLVIDFEGKIVSLTVDSSAETRELRPEFLPSFEGQDSTLAGVELVAGVTYSSTAIKNAVNDGFNTLIDNGLFAAAEKSADQLLRELLPTVYPALVSGSGAIQGEEAEGSGRITGGYQSSTGDGFAWFVKDGENDYLGVWTVADGAKVYDTAGEEVSDEALLQEIDAWSLECRKALLGDAVALYDRNDPSVESELEIHGGTVQSIYKNDTEQVYTLHLSTNQGFTKDTPIELTLVVDYEGKIVSVTVDRSGETKELSEDFLPSFEGQDSTLAGVEQVAGVTYSSTAIKNAVNDGFEALITNGLIVGAQKSADQLLRELLPTVYPALVSGSGAIQGEEAEGSGRITGGYQSSTGDGFAWFVKDGENDYLGVWTVADGAKVYDTAGGEVSDEALLQEIDAWSQECRKALLGDAVALYDRNDPSVESELEIHGGTVQSIYKNDTEQVYTLHLSTNQGFTKDTPIELTLVVDYEGKIVSVTVDRSGETKELSEDFLPSFEGQDSTLAGVELVAGVTYSSTAIKNAVNDGFEALITNGLIVGAQKSDEQLLQELVPIAYSGIVNGAQAIQGEELEGSGSVTGGYAAKNGGGCLWFVEKDGEKLLAVYTHVGGVTLYNPKSEIVTDSDPDLVEEIRTLSIACIGERDTTVPKTLAKCLPEGAEPVPAEIPGLTNSIVGAWTAETEEGVLYAFTAQTYGYNDELTTVYYVLDENGAIQAVRIKALFIEEEYFPNKPDLDTGAYREGFQGLTADSYTGEQSLIAGATLSSGAMKTATNDVFEAFALLTGNRG